MHSSPSHRAAAIYLTAGSMFASSTAKLFLLPLYAREAGFGHDEIGLLFSAGAVASALFALPAGIIVDRLGKMVMLGVATIAAISSNLAMSLTIRFEYMLLWQFIGGFGVSASMATLMAALAEVVPASHLGRSMGTLTLSNQIGYLAGPALAAISLNWLTLQNALAGSAILACMGLPLAFFTRRIADGEARRTDVASDLTSLAKRPNLASLVLALFAATLLWGTLEAYLPLLGKESMGLDNSQIGFMMSMQALMNGGSRIPSGWLIDRLTKRHLLIVLCILGYAGAVTFVPTLAGLYAASLVCTSVILIATAFVALSSSFAELAVARTKGTAMGLYVAVLYTGLAAGPAIFGRIIEAKGFGIGFFCCAATAASLAIVALALWRYEAQEVKSG